MNKTEVYNKVIIWTARISAAGILAFFYFFIGAHLVEAWQNPGPPLNLPLEEKGMMISGIVGILGLTLAFFKERLGGFISVLGMAAFFIIAPYLLSNVYFVLLMIPGILFLIHSFTRNLTLS